MILGYLWHTEGFVASEARACFHGILEAQHAMYSVAWDRPESVMEWSTS